MFFLCLSSLLFIIGYFSGFHDAMRKIVLPTPVKATPISFKVNFTVTVYPPNESTWQRVDNISHFHHYQVAMPSDYMLENDTEGVYTYEEPSGNTIIIKPTSKETVISKPTLIVNGYHVLYAGSLFKGIESDTAEFDLQTEDIIITYRGSQPSNFIPIINTFTSGFPATQFPAVPETIKTNLGIINYSSEDIADTLTTNITNCHNQNESLLHFLDHSSIITLDLNTCANTKIYSVKSVKKVTIALTPYAEVYYTDHTGCLLDLQTSSLKALAAAALSDWKSAPKVSEIASYPSLFCITPLVSTQYPTPTDFTDASYILQYSDI